METTNTTPSEKDYSRILLEVVQNNKYLDDEKRYELAREAIEKGANVNLMVSAKGHMIAPDENGITYLDPNVAKPENVKYWKQTQSLIFCAIQHRDIKMANFLIQNGADINATITISDIDTDEVQTTVPFEDCLKEHGLKMKKGLFMSKPKIVIDSHYIEGTKELAD